MGRFGPKLDRRGFLAATAVAGAHIVGCSSPPDRADVAEQIPGPPRRSTPVGFALGSTVLWATEAELRTTMDRVAEAGATMVRFDVSWTFSEPAEGHLDWSPSDRVVEAAKKRDLQILATVTNSPAWAAVNRRRQTGRPADPGRYAEFAGDVATHYAGDVSRYEIWNEPNGRLFFEPDPDPAFYTAMVRQAYSAIKSADSGATVVAGALGATDPVPGNIAPVEFLRQMYAAGAAGSFDALSYHPYDFVAPFAVGALHANSPTQQMVTMREMMVANGDGDKEIWLTEYGAPSGVVGPGRQATLVVDSVRQWPEVSLSGPLFVYALRDGGTDVSDPHTGFGLIAADSTPKPAFNDLKAVLKAGNPAREEFTAFMQVPDESLGLALTPLFTVTGGHGQQFEHGTRFKTPTGYFNSPPPVAAVARQWRIAPTSEFTSGYQDFEVPGGARIFSSESTGTHIVVGAILAAWNRQLGLATSDEYELTEAAPPRRVVDFENGRITWAPGVGARVEVW
ncbi:MAG: cellulase family glycosylhydrolase [Actinomycetota bacterium]|nr:cellulase family glycosylhydrolase [Actinomycetota bacterium]